MPSIEHGEAGGVGLREADGIDGRNKDRPLERRSRGSCPRKALG